MPRAPLLLLLVLLIFPVPVIAQDDCDTTGALDTERSQYLRALPRPEGANEMSWKIVQEIPNTIAPTTAGNAVRYGRSRAIFSEFLSHWNRSVDAEKAGSAITKEVLTEQSVSVGLVAPASEFLMFARAIYEPDDFVRIGNMLNPAIAAINPRLASLLCKEMGISTRLPSQLAIDGGGWEAIGRDMDAGLQFLENDRFAPMSSLPGLSGLNAAMYGGGGGVPRRGTVLLDTESVDLSDVMELTLERQSSNELRESCKPGCNWKSVGTAIDVFPIAAEAGPWGLGIGAVIVGVDNLTCKLECDEKIQAAVDRELAEMEANRKKQAEEREKATKCDPTIASCPQQPNSEQPNSKDAEKCKEDPTKCSEPQPTPDNENALANIGGDVGPPPDKGPDSACFASPQSIECGCENDPRLCPEPLDPGDPRCQTEQPDPGCNISAKNLALFIKKMLPPVVPASPGVGEPRPTPGEVQRNTEVAPNEVLSTILGTLADQLRSNGGISGELPLDVRESMRIYLDTSTGGTLSAEDLDELMKVTGP